MNIFDEMEKHVENDMKKLVEAVNRRVSDEKTRKSHTPEHTLYFYRAEPVRVVDGDTIVMSMDLGFHTYKREFVRLADVDTPEIRGVNATEEGQWALVFTSLWFMRAEPRVQEARSEGWTPKKTLEIYAHNEADGPFYLHSVRYDNRDKYGRCLGVVYREGDDITLGAALTNAGYIK